MRVDAGFVAGDVVPGEFDSMLAKIIAVGPTREEALSRLEEALDRTTVAIEGGASNRSLLLELITHDAFRRGPVTTRWLDRHLTQRGGPLERRHLDGALIAAAIGEYARARAEDVSDLLRHAHRGLPSNVPPPEPRSFRFSVGRESVSLEVTAIAPHRYRVSCGDALVEVGYTQTGACTAMLTLRGRRYPVTHVTTPTALHVEVDSVAHRLERAADGRVVAPVPAAVTHVFVREGDAVAVGDRLMTLEVMKMEVAITAPIAGRICRLLVEVASRVSAGHALAIVEAEHRRRRGDPGPRSPARAIDLRAPGRRRRGRDRPRRGHHAAGRHAGLRPARRRPRRSPGQVVRRRVPVAAGCSRACSTPSSRTSACSSPPPAWTPRRRPTCSPVTCASRARRTPTCPPPSKPACRPHSPGTMSPVWPTRPATTTPCSASCRPTARSACAPRS